MNTEACDNYAALVEALTRTRAESSAKLICYVTVAVILIMVVFFLLLTSLNQRVIFVPYQNYDHADKKEIR